MKQKLKLSLKQLNMKLLHPFETSFNRVTHHSVIIVQAEYNELKGYGECPASIYPYYSYETVYTAEYIINKFLFPIINDEDVQTPENITRKFNKIKGHNMAKGAVECALMDLYAKLNNTPLYKVYGGVKEFTTSGVSIGMENEHNIMMQRIQNAINEGYKRIKIKIKPFHDVEIIEIIRNNFPELPLMVDANCSYNNETFDQLIKLDKFNLMMIEQPFENRNFILHSKLQKIINTPICLDESIECANDLLTAIKMDSCKIVNIKLPRVGGPTNAKIIHDLCLNNNIKVWCGGILETGIGRLHNVAISSLEGFILPGDIGASNRYYSPDIIQPEVEVENGIISMPSAPGIGAKVLL